MFEFMVPGGTNKHGGEHTFLRDDDKSQAQWMLHLFFF